MTPSEKFVVAKISKFKDYQRTLSRTFVISRPQKFSIGKNNSSEVFAEFGVFAASATMPADMLVAFVAYNNLLFSRIL